MRTALDQPSWPISKALSRSAAGLRKDRGDTIKVLGGGLHRYRPRPRSGTLTLVPRRDDAPVGHGDQRADGPRRRRSSDHVFAIRPLTRALVADRAGDRHSRRCARRRSQRSRRHPSRRWIVCRRTAHRCRPDRAEVSSTTSPPKPRRSPQRRLEQMVEFDETHAADDLEAMGPARGVSADEMPCRSRASPRSIFRRNGLQ